jgi:hypothetical protein
LLLATLVGVGGGLGAGYLRQPQAASGGTATPMPAVSPSVPIDPPPSQRPFAEDISYPALEPGLEFRRLRMSNSQQAWVVPVPRGWGGFDVDTGAPVPRREWTGYDELRFRPQDEPDEGGFSLRVKVVNSRLTPNDMVLAKRAGLRTFDVIEWLGQTEESLRFTYRTASDRLRHNYFRWFAAPGSSEATLEMSVVGRERDVPGLEALFAAFTSTVRAVE